MLTYLFNIIQCVPAGWLARGDIVDQVSVAKPGFLVKACIAPLMITWSGISWIGRSPVGHQAGGAKARLDVSR